MERLCTKSNIEKLSSTIDEYRGLPAGWDGETDKATCRQCLNRAKEFLSYLKENNILPEESIGSGEEVALYWDDNKENCYLIIHFYLDNLRYYFQDGDQSSSGNLSYKESDMEKLLNLIPSVN